MTGGHWLLTPYNPLPVAILPRHVEYSVFLLSQVQASSFHTVFIPRFLFFAIEIKF